MEIVKYPNKILKKKSTKVDINKELISFVIEMKDFMNKQLKWGTVVGLAAPQVGRNVRLFFAQGQLYINPEIIWITKERYECQEGCYSLEKNKFDYKVDRAPSIKLRWQDLQGKWREKRFNGFAAQVIQHEMDHLEGKLCCK